MFALTLNPGFVLIASAILALAAPRGARVVLMIGAALLALWLLLDHEFGAAAAMAQMGLPVVLLDLDALNRIFGIALLIALIVAAIYASARRSRYEDGAILLMAGGAVSALFVGDLVSFVAASSLSGLGAAWVVFASPIEGAGRAGARLLMWHGLEGLLILVGVALRLSAGAESSVLARLDAEGISGGFILTALLIRVGAPLAHVWLKDAVGSASAAGASALSVFPSMLGVYALARFFPAAPILVPVAACMIVIGAFYAAAEDDLRRASAYGLIAQSGVCIALIGLGSPLALAAAEGHAFTTICSFLALQMALGNAQHRLGTTRASQLAGLGRKMPLTTALVFVSGLAVSAAPGFSAHASHALALEAAAFWEMRLLWALIAALPGVLFAGLALRAVIAANRAPAKGDGQLHEAPYAMLLAGALGAFFCVAVGLAPGWLYGLLPGELSFQPFALDRVGRQLEVLGVAGAIYVALAGAGSVKAPATGRLPDLDSLYSGPFARAGRWFGAVMMRAQDAFGAFLDGLLQRAGEGASTWVRACDRPYASAGDASAWLAIAAAAVAAVVAGQTNG